MLVGRPYEVMQNELDGDFSKMHVKIKFRIKEVIGNDALTEFVGHDVMKDFVRRQIRRDRGKIDDTVDVVTDDGFFIRLKPFIVTRSRVKGSQKQESRSIARNEIITFCAKSTWLGVQNSLMDGSLEEAVSQAVSKIQPVRAAFFRKSQLIQDGVVVDDGPTLEEIKAAEKAGGTPEYSVVFEDAHVGIEAGLAAKMKVIAVATTHPAESLSQAHLVCEDLTGISAKTLLGFF